MMEFGPCRDTDERFRVQDCEELKGTCVFRPDKEDFGHRILSITQLKPLSYHASATFVAIVDALAQHAEVKHTLREGDGIEQAVTDEELRN